MKKIKKLNNFVVYIENSTPKIKFIASETGIKRFVNKFIKQNPNPNDGCWVEFYVLGANKFVPVYEFLVIEN